MRTRRRLASLVALLVLVLGVYNAQAIPPRDPTQVTLEAFGSIDDHDGWCVSVTTTTANIWTSAPARIDAGERCEVRSVTLRHSDLTTTDAVFASRRTNNDPGANLTGDLDATSSGVIDTVRETITYQLRPPTTCPTGTTPDALWIVSDQAGGATLCVDVVW